jgi:hypothetical protein
LQEENNFIKVNLISKLILPLTFSLFTINSKAQDFLPGEFRNYSDKKIMTNYGFVTISDSSFMNLFGYDIYDDGIYDVIELYPVKVEGDSLIPSEYPVAYSLFFNKGEKPKVFYDSKMDGWTGDEEIFDKKKKIDYSILNL